MRALVVYAHPSPESYTAAVRGVVTDRLEAAGAEVQVLDLYNDGFDPRLTSEEFARYDDTATNRTGIEAHCDAVSWCDTLIFVYPTWWYGLPAALKGWLDRVLVPGLAFELPTAEGGDIKPGLRHITRLGVFTTCGASWSLTRFIGSPGRRTILRGIWLLCGKGCKRCFTAHYSMDSSTPESRAAHLGRVARRMDAFLGRGER